MISRTLTPGVDVHSPAEPTVSSLLLDRAQHNGPAMFYGDATWTWRRLVQRCMEHGGWFQSLAREVRAQSNSGQLHVGVLAENTPQALFLIGGAALSGHIIVALDSDRTFDELVEQVTTTHCDILLTDGTNPHRAIALATYTRRRLVDMSDAGRQRETRDALEGFQPAPTHPSTPLMVVFSPRERAPRPLMVTHRRITWAGASAASMLGLGQGDVICSPIPLYRAETLDLVLAPALSLGLPIDLPIHGHSGVLIDVQRRGCTYLHLDEAVLNVCLRAPLGVGDGDNPLRMVTSAGAPPELRRRFSERFRCRVLDTYGLPDSGIRLAPDPQAPAPVVGRLLQGISVLHPRSGQPCPPAQWDSTGRLLNPGEAIGELVNTSGIGLFDGYYNDPGGTAERVQDGMFFSGDLVFTDAEHRVYLVGAADDWRRIVDESLARIR